ncbi:acyltransferase [bacterium]|nr:acyltransferase [bacterium]
MPNREPGPLKKFRFYRPELDGLRFFAFLAVFVCHTSVFASLAKAVLPYSRELAHYVIALNRFGPLGVSLFFSLSSFLITKLLLLEEDATGGQVSVGHFYARRALRIWPVYFLSLLVLQLWVTPFNQPMNSNTLLGFCLFLGNWVMAYLGRLHNCVLILWSISVEEQFYLVWPWLFRLSRSFRVRLFWALIPLAWLVRGAMAHGWAGSQDFRFVTINAMGFACNSFFHLDTFALGALLAVYETPLLSRFGNRRWLIFALLSLVLLSRYFFGAPTSVLASMGQGVVAFSCMLVVVNSFDTRWLAHPLLVWLGRMTYGLYVYHFFALRVVEFAVYQGRFPGPDFLPTVWTSLAVAGLGLAATVGVASLSFYGLEQPVLRLKGRYTKVLSGKAE